VNYLAVRYILWGSLFGSAIIFTYKSLSVKFETVDEFSNLLRSPLINCVLSIAISYILFRGVREGALSIGVLSLRIDQDHLPGGLIFLGSVLVSLAVERYTAKIVEVAIAGGGKRLN
jgi:hypothetical protein